MGLAARGYVLQRLPYMCIEGMPKHPHSYCVTFLSLSARVWKNTIFSACKSTPCTCTHTWLSMSFLQLMAATIIVRGLLMYEMTSSLISPMRWASWSLSVALMMPVKTKVNRTKVAGGRVVKIPASATSSQPGASLPTWRL